MNYLVQCLDPDHVCHNITTMDVPPRQMKHTLHTRHYPTVQPMLAATKKETLQAVHTEAVTRAINSQQPNRVLHNRPPPISLEEDTLRRPQRTTLSQLRSGHCRLLNSYQNRLKQTVDPRCPDCGVNPHDVPHLFNCTAHPNTLSTVNLWDKPVESIRELSFLDPRNLDWTNAPIEANNNNNRGMSSRVYEYSVFFLVACVALMMLHFLGLNLSCYLSCHACSCMTVSDLVVAPGNHVQTSQVYTSHSHLQTVGPWMLCAQPDHWRRLGRAVVQVPIHVERQISLTPVLMSHHLLLLFGFFLQETTVSIRTGCHRCHSFPTSRGVACVNSLAKSRPGMSTWPLSFTTFVKSWHVSMSWVS